MGVNIFVHFDNPGGVFKPGAIITGNVSVNTTRQTVTKGLTLSFHGEGKVHWTETRTVRTHHNQDSNHSHPHHRDHHHHPQHHDHHPQNAHHRHHHDESRIRHITREYKNQETYLNNFFALPLGDCTSGTTIELPAGFYQQIPFTFQLPLNIPASCMFDHGSIAYFAEASLKVQQSLLVFTTETTKTARKDFTILGSLDLNLMNGALCPLQKQEQKQFGFLCCSSGEEFVMDLRLARSGFIAGEPIMFQMDYSNKTDITFKKMEACLTQVIQFITFGKEKSQENKINVVTNDSKIFPRTEGNWNSQLRIPPTIHLTDLGGSRIILIRYTFTVKVSASYGRNVKINMPITLGTMSGGNEQYGFMN